jgi:hypothetical protein
VRADPGRFAQRRPAGRHRAVGQRGRRPAEDQRFGGQPVPDTARPDPEPGLIAAGHHRAAAERDRDQVWHPEVGPDAADFDPV